MTSRSPAGRSRPISLTLAFSPRELLVGHLVKIEIGGLKAALTLGKDGLELGGRPLATSSPGGGPSRLQTLSIDALDLKDAEISLVTPGGSYAGTLSATIALAGGNLKATAVDATLTAPVAGMKGPVTLAFTGDLEVDERRYGRDRHQRHAHRPRRRHERPGQPGLLGRDGDDERRYRGDRHQPRRSAPRSRASASPRASRSRS